MKTFNIWYISSFVISLIVIIPVITVFSSYFESTSDYFELLKNTFLFEYISNSCASTLSQLTLNSAGIPIMFGVITAYTREQALKRSEVNFGSQENKNIGYNVANAAIEILSSKEKHRL